MKSFFVTRNFFSCFQVWNVDSHANCRKFYICNFFCLLSEFLQWSQASFSVAMDVVNIFWHTVKLVYNDHPRDHKFVAVVDRWSLFRGSSMLQRFKLGLQNGGCCRQVVAIRRWSLAQVWLYKWMRKIFCQKQYFNK